MRRLCRLAELGDPGSARLDLPEHPYGYSLCLVHLDGQVHGYLNSCPHTDSPMDWQPGRFLTPDGRYIQCSLHGAMFEVDGGRCVAGPCRGDRLTPVFVYVEDGIVYLGETFD
ncbi:Rieske 2Fe-2S domain-containing protein [uncultured Abyssibacter sp.]|uniref:Rieske (2Fe-2S) protein n=1 Tax=uncultured Abyssibacter sp. TaxID=2320202 RepID=UPI0032B1A8C2